MSPAPASGGRPGRRSVAAPRVAAAGALEGGRWRRTGPYRALGHAFAVQSTDEMVGGYLEAVLAPLRAGNEAATTYSVTGVGAGDDAGFALYEGSQLLVASNDPAFVVDTLLWAVNGAAVRQTPDKLLVHAAAAGDGTCAALFPGPSGSGKTTLVAGLLQAGLRYFTDETVAIDPDSLAVHPYPRSLTVKEGSWPVLAELRPERPPELLRLSGGQWHLDPSSVGGAVVAEPAPAAFVIVPRYVAGAATTLDAMSRADAVVLLARSCFNLKRHGPEGLTTLARVARASACYRLVMGDLGQATALVQEIMRRGALAGVG